MICEYMYIYNNNNNNNNLITIGISENLFEPEIDPSEWPENREKITQADIDAFEDYQIRLKSDPKAKYNPTLALTETKEKNNQSDEESDQEDVNPTISLSLSQLFTALIFVFHMIDDKQQHNHPND